MKRDPSSRTDDVGNAEKSFGVGAPSIALPKGGGAIRGIGEKFSANPVTGTGSTAIPIATSPGRAGFGPQLSLSYDSGAGNGPFGFGWNLSLPSITRKTDKGLPQYLDAQESDVFVLSGAEDLVPVFRQDQDGSWTASHPGYRTDRDDGWVSDQSGKLVVHEDEIDGYRVRRYRPRIEGLFARIERWSRIGAVGDVHWRSYSKDNILSIYGLDKKSRIADPIDSTRIFSWLICETRDDKGNAVLYDYKKEDGAKASLSKANERNRGERNDQRRTANRYLKRIFYGNRTPLLDGSGRRPRVLTQAQINGAGWMFEVVLDYGEHHGTAPSPGDAGDWAYRLDPFSSYRSGFEVRTTRICRRVLMFHHFPDNLEVGADCLVRSTDFTYTDELEPPDVSNPIYTFLRSVTQRGYRRNGPGYDSRSLPPVEFEYTQPTVQDEVEQVDAESLENLPIGVDGNIYRWTDLHGEGIPGILSEQAGAWYYKRNLSPLTNTRSDDQEQTKAKFAALETVATKPNVTLIGGAEVMDLAGDGQPDIVLMEGPAPGFYEHDEDEGWLPFRSFTSRLHRDLKDPNVRFVDLDGDGHADVLITEDNAFVWHPSLGESGFGPARRAAQALDEEDGPRIVFADPAQSIYVADLSGDGLADIVRIRNGDVCYWPNLGRGRFGAKVTMDNAPWFDNPDQFDHKRIRLADIDGSGTADIIYLHRDGVRLYFNQSGNAWSKPQTLKVFPRVDEMASIMPADLLGNGTACLVWSSSLAGDAQQPMRYVNLMGGSKPHLLVKTTNNLGAETRVQYAPSTKFYLRDRLDGRPWITRLPFPVHVVERVETWDHISRNRFVTRYAYHHGHFDGVEREFRGFGMVEQWDTETLAALSSGEVPAENIDSASHVPPVHTKTWFHTGIYFDRQRVSRHFAGLLDTRDRGEYFREPGLTDAEAELLLLPDTVLPGTLTLEEEREACRALKGSMLRREVYALDAGSNAKQSEIERARTPYTVTEQNFGIRAVQTRGINRHAVFFVHPLEAISYHYERNAADPRVQHALTLDVDEYGNVTKQVAIGYGRREFVREIDDLGRVRKIPNPGLQGLRLEDQARQTDPLLTYTESRLTNSIETTETHRAPVPCEELTFELTEYTATGPDGRFQASDIVELDPAMSGRLQLRFAGNVEYEVVAVGARRRRLIECVRTLFRRDDLDGLLALGDLETLGLPGESYRLAFTPGLLAQVLKRPHAGQPLESLLPDPAAVLAGHGEDQGGYLQSQSMKARGLFPASDADGNWWQPSGQSFFSDNPADTPLIELAQARSHFFLPHRYRDPFGGNTVVDFDTHDLLMRETRDALDNRITVRVNDYRVLQPRLVSDPNRNQTATVFDILGMVVGAATMGKPLPAQVEGDSVTGFVADPAQDDIDALFNDDPRLIAATLLQDATSRIVYDVHRFYSTRQAQPDDPSKWQPPCVAVLARETHATATPPPHGHRIQLSFSYSDGFGREIQKKVQAEAGQVADGGPEVDPRWVSTGWTIFNNKGKPVRRYEPFFSRTHDFEFGVMAGVSPVLFYDPADRVVATLHPNHTFEKAVFDAWQQTSFDVNDTCALRNDQTGDPRTDPDIKGYVAGYFGTIGDAWQTWHEQRSGGQLGPREEEAANRAAAHADTPTTTHLDVLGRSFLTVARNRVACADHDLDGTEQDFFTRIDLDIEGNQRSVRDSVIQAGDPLGRIVMRYAYNMLGNHIQQESMEAGARWMLNDVTGKPIRAWDSRGHNLSTAYDLLRRPTTQTLRGVTASSDPRSLNRDIVIERTEYGEGLANAETLNLRTRVVRHFDPAGAGINGRVDANGDILEAYDFKGNLLHSTRRLIADYKSIPDWSTIPVLEDESFMASTRFDALNRPIQSIAPHSSFARAKRHVIQPRFNEANLLDRIDVWLNRVDDPADLIDAENELPSAVGVANINYDAKGQRVGITYKNGASTRYGYDATTFRLIRLYTRRGPTFTEDCANGDPPPPTIAAPDLPPESGACGLQNLSYTYDPAGNIVRISDDAQQTAYFRNQRVEPSCNYVYDALYRLIQATGREHLGQIGGAPIPHSRSDAGRIGVLHPEDGNAMGAYVERYVYDTVGNFLKMQHRGRDPQHPGWTRAYDTSETSLIETGADGTLAKASNRLSRTILQPEGAVPTLEPYQHDAHGNVVRMPQLGGGAAGPNLHWDYKDQLRKADLTSGAAFYVYDADGRRVRKVWEKAANLIEERLYLGGFEIYRRHSGAIGVNSATLERETLHVMDDKQRIALVETRTLDTAGDDAAPEQIIRYQFGNHLGSASLELDQDAQIISYEEYAPYGSSTFQAVRNQTETAKRYRYTGKERDEETGLYYHGARYYASWLGRWASCDPSELVDGANLYAYVRGKPLQLTDPTGHTGELPPPTYLPKPTGPWDVDADRLVRRKVEAGSGPWKGPRTTKAAGNAGATAAGFDPKTRVLGHESGAHWQSKAGDVDVVRNEPAKGPGNNSSRGATIDRPAAGKARAAGEYARDVKGNDPTAAPGTRRTARAVPPSTPVTPKPGSAAQPVVPPAARAAPPALSPPKPTAAPVTTPEPIAATPKPLVVEPTPSPSIGRTVAGGAVTGVKVAAPMIFFWGIQKVAQNNYDEAAKLRDQYIGTPTQAQIERQRMAGWEHTGKTDKQGHPEWNYNPSLLLRFRDASLFLVNPFDPIRTSGRNEDWGA